jgi:hypothetical protein
LGELPDVLNQHKLTSIVSVISDDSLGELLLDTNNTMTIAGVSVISDDSLGELLKKR